MVNKTVITTSVEFVVKWRQLNINMFVLKISTRAQCIDEDCKWNLPGVSGKYRYGNTFHHALLHRHF